MNVRGRIRKKKREKKGRERKEKGEEKEGEKRRTWLAWKIATEIAILRIRQTSEARTSFDARVVIVDNSEPMPSRCRNSHYAFLSNSQADARFESSHDSSNSNTTTTSAPSYLA